MTPVWNVAPHPEGTPAETPGSFREHDIQPFPGGMMPPTWVSVPADMAGWMEMVADIKPRSVDFPDRIAAAHCRFECIHPFLDGNGRAGRLVLNLILVRMGYPPAIIYKNQRARYLAALRRADDGDYGSLGELIARAVLDNLYKFVMPAVAGPARIVPIAALATAEMNVNALRAAAVRSALQATKGADGQWRSCRNWVDEYVATRHRRRGL
jgi:fido (protein-threonine AMPylation protein)